MKEKIKTFLKRRGYTIKKSKPTPDFSGGRFTPAERKFFGKTIYIHDILAFELTYYDIFEDENYRFAAKTDAPYIVDCGANMGMSIIYFKQLYPSSKILAFEADRHIFGFLQKNVRSFGFKDVEIVNKAVWNSETTVSFAADGGAGSRIVTDENSTACEKVSTVRLRDILTGIKTDFLKIDIEGAEYEVIKDCADIIHNIDNIFIEYHSTSDKTQTLDEILRIVKNAGFRYHIKEAYTARHPFVSRELNNDMDLQLNIFCFK